MYLKALELQGFKSFPDKTRLTFEKDITAIVGPNGSGKSNLSDAIMWVTGEQRTKTLRGSKMEDVIFGGTEKRNPMGFSQVSLVFDNSSRIFDRDSDELILSRRFYRSGESEYSINRESCRLKDVQELLMDTGLGRDGYSIIGQGRISEIVSTKSTDRREVFEEAAGISRFRHRKSEAEDRLAKTEENLVRINDKIEELELQVGPLRQQAETAKKYLLLRDDLRIKEISVWLENIDRIKERTKDIQQEYAAVDNELESAKADLEAMYASAGNLTERMRQQEAEAEKARGDLSKIVEDISARESAVAVIGTEIKNNSEKMQRLLMDMQEQEKRSKEIKANIESNLQQIEALEDKLKELETENKKNSNVIAGCNMKLNSRQASLSKIREEATACDGEITEVKSRIAILSELEKDYDGYSKSVKYIMREASRGNLQGVFGPVAGLIEVEDEYALAIETALGASSQHIVVDTQKTSKAAIELLKRTDNGRATFIPVDTVRAPEFDKNPVDDTGFIATASELVSCDDSFLEIVEDLLGGTLVVNTLSDAIRISNKLENRVKIVSLDGQLIHPGGSMTGGSAVKNAGMVSRKNELKKLAEKLKSLSEKQTGFAERLKKAGQELEEVNYNLRLAMEDSASLAAESSSCRAEKRTLELSTSQLNALLYSITGDSDQRREAVRQGEEEKVRLEEKKTQEEELISGLRKKADEVREIIALVGERKSSLEDKRSKTEKDAQKLSLDIMELERKAAKIEQKKQSSEAEEHQILDKLWDNYELGYTAASALRQNVDSMQKATREIAAIKGEIAKLGTPNIGAIDEYSRVSTRYDFLTSQRDDILKAKADIKKIISDITGEMTEIFKDRFDKINTEFKQIFVELFNGGKAELVLEDEDNVLTCGIDIRVQPPGKALSTISLLSGGEMAFVAIALYFAIMKVRPTPFCVMDEIEAALDEANVDRFAGYLRKMSDATQFVVITHRRGTMETADMLYGVTMQEKGVSKVIHLNLETAEKLQEGKL